MPIIVSQTFQIVTEESAEHGEAAESGFDFENQSYGFRELVEYIKSEGFTNSSDSHGVPRWLTSEVVQDRAWLERGEDKTFSLHPASDARSLRYWEKACRAADILKDAKYWRGMIVGIHANGYRAEVTYKTPHGYSKGLATHNPTKGVGPEGVLFVCVDSFTNRVHLDNVISVKRVVQ
jgi:hypothetical protein